MPEEHVAQRFFAKVIQSGDCWLWTGAKIKGYGHFGRSELAHRWAYEYLVAAIPEGLELDHLCRVTACVNPFHLDPVTHRVNMRRSPHQRKPGIDAPAAAFQRAKTRCPQGHLYDDQNTYVNPRGHRFCRRCARERMRARRRAGPTRPPP